ncbi:MAG: hypothetical protein QXG00_04825 [Candidatus Woesearchaeota archaeon]
MVFPNPFSKEVATEIRQVATILFDGGDVSVENEIYELYQKWSWWFDMFFMCIDRENASWLRLPSGNNPSTQGYKTMQIMNYIQSLYIKKLNDLYKGK